MRAPWTRPEPPARGRSPWFTTTTWTSPSWIRSRGRGSSVRQGRTRRGAAAGGLPPAPPLPEATSVVSAGAYERLMRTPPYRPDLDWVALDVGADGRLGVRVADAATGRGPDRAGRLPTRSIAAWPGRGGQRRRPASTARDVGATTGLVCPRGDDGYPVPMRVYQQLGFPPPPPPPPHPSSPAPAPSPSSAPLLPPEALLRAWGPVFPRGVVGPRGVVM